MNTGTVKFFNDSKGYGFINGDDGQEIFVHVSGLVDSITKEDRVEYEISDGRKGPNAVQVRKI